MKKSIDCPICRGALLSKNNLWTCSKELNSHGGCKFTIPAVVLGHILSPEDIRILVDEKKTGLISDFKSKRGNFSACLKLVYSEVQLRWSIEFDFSTNKVADEINGDGFSQADYLFDDETRIQINSFSAKKQALLASGDFLALPLDLRKRVAHSLNMVDVTYAINGDQVCASSVNRLESFVFGSPFTSLGYPVPRNRSGDLMCPLMQINLKQVSDSTHHKFPDGLLQLWFSIANFEEFVRFVPASDLSEQLNDFEVSTDDFNDINNFMPDSWPRVNPGCCIKIESIKSTGVVTPDVSESLLQDIELNGGGEYIISELRGVEENFSTSNFNTIPLFYLFGGFRSSVYKSDDVDFNCRSFIFIPVCAGNLYLNIFFSVNNLDKKFFSSIGK